MITQQDIDDAQRELEEVIRIARGKGLSFKTSRSWALSLGKVATLRRRYEQQQKMRRGSDKPGWNKVT